MFYDFTVDIMKITEIKNELGQRVPTPVFLKAIECDIQPSTQKVIRDTFGDAVESVFLLFCDEDLENGTVINLRNKFYEVNDKVDWLDYRIYSLKGSDRF